MIRVALLKMYSWMHGATPSHMILRDEIVQVYPIGECHLTNGSLPLFYDVHVRVASVLQMVVPNSAFLVGACTTTTHDKPSQVGCLDIIGFIESMILKFNDDMV